MKIGDQIYFAPEVRFSELDLGGPKLPDQYRARIDGYYLRPAKDCVTRHHAFAAGLLVLSAIDSMSRLYFGPNRRGRVVRKDFRAFTRLLLPSFRDPNAATILYEKFRNGLVHEARLKDGCQFQLGLSATLDLSGMVPVVNPDRLLHEVQGALDVVVTEMKASQPFRVELAKLLRREFAYELGDAA